MKINLSPQRRDEKLKVEVTGDRIRINGELFNFNPLEEGDSVPHDVIPCEWITGDVSRKGGEIEITLILPHGPNPPQEVAFPSPIQVVEDGPVNIVGQQEEVSENVDS